MNNAPKPRPWTARIFSLETILGIVGLGLLIGGALRGSIMPLFWGGITLGGLGLLYLVRKKDWKKHWEEQARNRGGQDR